MADAKVNDDGLTNEFVRGFGEGREAVRANGYRVRLRFEGTTLRDKTFDDLTEALTVLGQHLAQGQGCSGSIDVVVEQLQELESGKGVSG